MDHCLFSTIERNVVLDDTLTIFILNVLSLAKYLNNIVHDYSCLKNVFESTETQMKPSDCTSIIDDTLKGFNINFNNYVSF